MENYIAGCEFSDDMIIEMACQDYIKNQLSGMGIIRKVNEKTGDVTYTKKNMTYSRSKCFKDVEKTRKEILELLSFFKSEYFKQLCDYSGFDGDQIIKRLNMIVKNYVDEFHEAMKIKNKEIVAERKRKKDAA